MSATTVFAYLTTRCNAKCNFCYLSKEYSPDLFLKPKELEAWLELLRPLHVVLLGGEPTLLAMPNSKPSLMEYVQVARSFNCRVTLETNGLLLALEKDLMSPLYGALDNVSVSLEYVQPSRNIAVGRWPKDIMQDLFTIAAEHHNVSFTSVYLYENLGDILMLAEWSLIHDKPYLVKCDKSMGQGDKPDEAREAVNMLYRYLYMLLKSYGEDPYKGRIMVEEPSWIAFLDLQTGARAKTGCSAGKRIYSILPNGALTPCPLGAMFYYVISKGPDYTVAKFDPLEVTGRGEKNCKNCVYHVELGCNGCPAMGYGGSAKICPLYRPAPAEKKTVKEVIQHA
jgi:MoaA/NifB/PqqE/SkfB family radical SAM enzyme